MSQWRLRAAVAAVLMAVLLTGCPRKPQDPEPDPWGQIGETDAFGEDGIAPGSSLDRYRRGLPMDGDADIPGTIPSPLQTVYFGFDSSDLTEPMRAILRSNADWIRSNPNHRIEIEGHCDERGTSDYNLALGGRRARAVREYLVALGVPASQLTTISYGKEMPVCYESNESCWSRNRRAHFVVRGTR